MNISVNGLDKLMSAFEKARVELPIQLKNAMFNSVKQIRTSAQEIVPVRTGMLKKSIQSTYTITPFVGTVSVGQPYGKYVEFGTWKMRAQPFMRPSMQKNIKYIQDQFTKARDYIIRMMK